MFLSSVRWRFTYEKAADSLCYAFALDLRSIQPYSQIITPTKPSNPSHGPSTKSSGTNPIGASFDNATIKPALITPHKLSPTIKPDATSVPRRSARCGFAASRARLSYQCPTIAPTTTANVADIGR